MSVEPHDVRADDRLLWMTGEDGGQLLAVELDGAEIIDRFDMPYRPHALAIADGGIWVTMIGRGDLASADGASLVVFATRGTPRDVTVDALGQVW